MNCFIACVAYMIDVKPIEVVDWLINQCHIDPDEKVWENYPRGVHPQELLPLITARGYMMGIVYKHTNIAPDYESAPIDVDPKIFDAMLEQFHGIVIGKSSAGITHACVWINNHIYDVVNQNGKLFDPQIFLPVVKMI